MTASGFALFETAVGKCAMAWGGNGIVGLQLPEASEGQSRARIQRCFAAAHETTPPPAVRQVIGGIVALLAGEAVDLSKVALDMDATSTLDRRVYAVARTIQPGATLTYGEVASRLGDARLARVVGQALGRNPFALLVPCHRVLAANGRLGGFSASGGPASKLRLLQIEGARIGDGPDLFERRAEGG